MGGKFLNGIILGLMLLSCTGATNEKEATVYFVPFALQTYVPITESTIVCDAWEIWTLSDTSKVSSLLGLVTKGSNGAVFDEKNIRVKIIRSNEPYYIDSEGTVLKGRSTFSVDRAKFANFAETLAPGERQRNLRSSCEKSDK
jgi:hypothetical protein